MTTYTLTTPPTFFNCTVTTTPVGAAAAVPPHTINTTQMTPFCLTAHTCIPTLFLCTLPPSFGCPPPAQAGGQAQAGHAAAPSPAQNTDFLCTFGPTQLACPGAAQAFRTGTTGCTFPTAQGQAAPQPYTNVTVAYPNTHDQQCFNRTYVWPPTQTAQCGTSPVAQGAQAQFCTGDNCQSLGAAQGAQAQPFCSIGCHTVGGPSACWPSIPPHTVCCYR